MRSPPVPLVAALAAATLVAGVVTVAAHDSPAGAVVEAPEQTGPPPLKLADRQACPGLLRLVARGERDLRGAVVDGRPQTTREAVFELLSRDAAAIDQAGLVTTGALRSAVDDAALALEGVAIGTSRRGVADPADVQGFRLGSSTAARLCAGRAP